MKLHEYESKQLLYKAGVPVPRGAVITDASQVPGILNALGIESGVVKAQVHTGGRGKAGGVRPFKTESEASKAAREILGMTLVTKQTGPEGLLVKKVMIEESIEVIRELYVAITIDRTKGVPVIMISPEGGMDIEEIAKTAPEKILKIYPDPETPISDELARKAAAFLGLTHAQVCEFCILLNKLYSVFQVRDCSLLEINPFAIDPAGRMWILDCKFDVDDNAVFRQQDIVHEDESDADPSELEAARFGMSFIKLDGDIGCMVNGAGLAMATMDIILREGKNPANFLDVGGSASETAVANAIRIITSDPKVKAILVNIFGGIMRCDTIAKGIVSAVSVSGLKVPMVVRLEGNSVLAGKAIIESAGLGITFADDMADAARKVVALAGGVS
jgi:succinyl-CoA synthetase beta subunit